MTQYAHIDNPIPQKLPHEFQHAGGLTMGLDAMSAERLAELGWYPVRREPLEPGASGYAPIELIGSEFVIASMPGDLEAVKAQKHAERHTALIAARDAGFDYDGHRFDSDPASRELIQQAVIGAMLAQSMGMTDAQFSTLISGGWRNTDGVPVVATIAGMIALGLALGAHMGRCDQASQAQKIAIDTA
ncbi:DUF4376 domain-containing protein [Thiocystis violascens]|uniref:DUF4376 domain-containing protein n=1 Tax=Thiocystis violascens (strain ATCC 17096 / DSM 198 / 6111) TaxID=765911 RepID=I3YEI6_THIV6|nr:DUF4376 domain-containing protein [Thiocystis violascens]AFL75404.1 hypothetical protein Thivi_3537 [Thiocystis violascens DSM 198]